MSTSSPTALRRAARLPASMLPSALLQGTLERALQWTLLGTLLTGSMLLQACGGSSESKRPNVLLITLDTTRPDYFSCYGYKPGHTPVADKLAQEGARFEQCMSASAVTPVSHATILTGMFPYGHKLRVLSGASGFKLAAGQATLASAFKAEGYHTGAAHSAFPVSGYFGFNQSFDRFESFDIGMKHDAAKGTSWDTDQGQRRSDLTTRITLEIVDEFQASDPDAPFFMWVHYWDAHDPTLIPDSEYLDGVPLKDGKIFSLEGLEKVYPAEVRFVDAQMGVLLEGLKSRGLLENTVIALTSDHGEGLADGFEKHNWRAHRMVYEEQIWVPLILSGPGVRAGGVIPELVRTADIAPTLLDYAGLPPLDGLRLHGSSLRGLIEGQAEPGRIGYADQVNGFDTNAKMVESQPQAKFLYCIRDGDWKFTYRPHMHERSELFNLDDDPDEQNNLMLPGFTTATEHRDVFLGLAQELARRSPWVLVPFADDGSVSSEDAARADEILAAQGYASSENEGTGSGYWAWMPADEPTVRFDFSEADDRGRHPATGKPMLPVEIK